MRLPRIKSIKGIRIPRPKGFSVKGFGINKIFGALSHEVGIDLGTANTLVWVKDKGIVIREPSVVARIKKSKEILAIGESAYKMQGRTPNTIDVVRPLRDGVIADFDATEAMLDHYIKAVHESGTVIPKVPRPKVVIGIPSGVTEVERRAVSDAAVSAGASEAHLIEEPMAAAIGAELPIEKTEGVFIVDIGGGTTDIAVISLGGIVLGKSVRIAGDEMNEAIANYVRLKYSLLLGLPTAEKVKMDIGTARPDGNKFQVVRGRDLETGLPKSVKLASSEISEALLPTIQEIISSIVELLEETPPELVADVSRSSIVLAGGGALLPGLDKLISERTKMPVTVANDPLTCVVRGCGKILTEPGLLKKVKLTQGL